MIKKGISIWSFPPLSYKEVFEKAKNAGFDCVELSLTEEGELGLRSGEKLILSVKKMAEDIGIELKSFASNLAWANPITSGDKKIRENGVKYLNRQIEVAGVLGADTVLLVPGYVGVDFIPGSEVVDYEDAYKRAEDGISQAIQTAKKCKVAIGIENVWNKFLLSPLEMRSFIDSFKSEYVGSYLDVGNVIYSGYPEQWIKILAHRIKKVHFKDYRRSVGTLDGFVDLLAGDVDYTAVMEALRSINYDSVCTAEMIPPYKQNTIQTIYSASKSMDAILK